MKFTRPELAQPAKHSKAVRREFVQRQKTVAEAFRLHKERLRPLLPAPLQALQEQYVHDAWITSLFIDPAQKTLEMRLIVCDTPGGVDLTLQYQDIQLTEQEISLLCFIAREKSAEIDWAEVDRENPENKPPVFIHRILWNTNLTTWPHRTIGKAYVNTMLCPEMELRFGGFFMTAAPHIGDFPETPATITIVRDVEKIG